MKRLLFYRSNEQLQSRIKFVMVQCWYCCCKGRLFFLVVVIMSSSSSSLQSSSSILVAEKITMTCAVKYNQYRYDYYLYFDLHDKLNLHTSRWEFYIDTCYPGTDNNFCSKWIVQGILHVCNRTSIKNRVLCLIKKIDPGNIEQAQIQYRFYAKYNSTYYFKKRLYQLTELQCECKEFYFDPNLYISTFPLIGEAKVSIKPFLEPKSDIIDFDMTIIPNDTLNIIKDGDKFQYQLSKLDSCEKYWLDISLTLKGTTFKRKCKNDWKMNPGIINLQIPKLDINEVSCYYNLTYMNLTSTSAINSKFYYNLTIGDESFYENFTSNESFSFKLSEKILSENLTSFVSLCVPECKKCGTTQPIMCYSKMESLGNLPNDSNEKSDFISMEVILSIIVVIVFAIVISGVLISIRWCSRERQRMVPSSEVIAPRDNNPNSNFPSDGLAESETVKSINNEPLYEEIKEYHHYDKPELLSSKSFVLSGVSDKEENNAEFLDQNETHYVGMNSFLSCAQDEPATSFPESAVMQEPLSNSSNEEDL